MSEFKHYTVLLNETCNSLNAKNSNKIFIDATLGGGGHSELILKQISPSGKLIAFDVDQEAIKYASSRLKGYNNLTIINDSYVNIPRYLEEMGIKEITGGIIYDLGASYYQLTSEKRGFSFLKDSPLDMRFGNNQDITAYDVVNGYSEEKLVEIFSHYGQERFSKTIAKEIVKKRKVSKINTTLDLANLIKEKTPHIKSKIHPATKVFQAIRIEVNQELQNIKLSLLNIIPLLSIDAIISVISFHSLEDGVVKEVFKMKSKDCNCKPNDPICNCPKAQLKLINKKPIIPTDQEIFNNPASRSAKLRIAQRI